MYVNLYSIECHTSAAVHDFGDRRLTLSSTTAANRSRLRASSVRVCRSRVMDSPLRRRSIGRKCRCHATPAASVCRPIMSSHGISRLEMASGRCTPAGEVPTKVRAATTHPTPTMGRVNGRSSMSSARVQSFGGIATMNPKYSTRATTTSAVCERPNQSTPRPLFNLNATTKPGGHAGNLLGYPTISKSRVIEFRS